MSQIVTVSFFRYHTLRQRWWAFGEMGKRPIRSHATDGLSFAKMLGTGGGNGFSIRPNWGVYAALCVWDSETDARKGLKTSLFTQFQAKAAEHFTVFLRTYATHGTWDGATPFALTVAPDLAQPTAVLTRATIRWSRLRQFWQFVPSVSRSMQGKAGLLFSVGVGELPLVQQATFSLWQTGQQMKDYAYGSPAHAEVVRKTRELDWYSEELFARFRPFDVQGETDQWREVVEGLRKMW